MRLAFIKQSYSIHGGGERYLRTLINTLENAGHEIHVFARRWEPEGNAVFHPVPVIPCISFLKTGSFALNVGKALRKAGSFDCVVSLERTQCQDIYRAGEGCHAEWLAIRSRGESLFKRFTFRINPLHILHRVMEKMTFERTPVIVANSEMVREHIIKHYRVPGENIITIYNGVDTQRFSPENKIKWRAGIRRELALPEAAKILLFVGSGFKRKGLGTLIDALPYVKTKGVKAVIIGKGKINGYTKRARRKGVSDSLLFLTPRENMEKYYAAADLFVLPTLYDPFSNASIEAMASGLPVVTTRNNGAAELIADNTHGFVLGIDSSAQEWARAIDLSLESSEWMGANARAQAERFPIEKAAKAFTDLILRGHEHTIPDGTGLTTRWKHLQA